MKEVAPIFGFQSTGHCNVFGQNQREWLNTDAVGHEQPFVTDRFRAVPGHWSRAKL